MRGLPGVNQVKVTDLLQSLELSGISVIIPGELKVCKDPDDDKFLETALIGKAKFLVTKNTKHFPAKSYKDVRIVKVSKFLQEIEKQFPQKQ